MVTVHYGVTLCEHGSSCFLTISVKVWRVLIKFTS